MQEITIYDIARMAGVSASTVSRVINERPNVKKSTKAKVLKLLAEYRYVPNETARGLVNQSSKMIGILISDIRTTHHTDGVYYLEKELSLLGYSCIIYNTGVQEAEQSKYFQTLSQRKVEAVVLMGSVYQTETVDSAIRLYLPATPVFMCNAYLEAPNVYGLVADEQNGVCNCARLLAQKGRKNLAFIVNHYTPSNRAKKLGFETGVSLYCGGAKPIVVETGDSIKAIYDAAQRLVREHPQIDGLICSEDFIAAVVLRALKEMGIPVPEKMGVIGINNSQYAEICTPTLTSLDNMLYDLSLTTAHNLIAVLQGQHINKKMMIYSKIVERQTT